MDFQIELKRKIVFTDVLMYIFLFVCIFTSNNWASTPELTPFEIFRFDNIYLFGQINVFSLFAGIFAFILFFYKFGPQSYKNHLSDRNYIKTVFWLYLILVNIFIYLTINVKEIQVQDLGVRPIVVFFVFLVTTYYIQDIFFSTKSLYELGRILTVFQVLILLRAFYTILKYFFGVGKFISIIGKVRIGQENDFADYFILLFIIALTRILFEKSDNKNIRRLNYLSLFATSYISILSFRRYLWIEYVLSIGIIFFVYSFKSKTKLIKRIIATSSIVFILSSGVLLIGTERLTQNYYLGRFLTAFSLVDSRFESEYGSDTRHPDHLREGWDNVKRFWLFGVSPYGGSLLQRKMTIRHKDTFFHNAFLSIWIEYGLLGILLFIFFYLKSLRVGYEMYFKYGDILGLMLSTFLICQLTKNIVWDSFISKMNVTIIYIFFISLVLKTKKCSKD